MGLWPRVRHVADGSANLEWLFLDRVKSQDVV